MALFYLGDIADPERRGATLGEHGLLQVGGTQDGVFVTDDQPLIGTIEKSAGADRGRFRGGAEHAV